MAGSRPNALLASLALVAASCAGAPGDDSPQAENSGGSSNASVGGDFSGAAGGAASSSGGSGGVPGAVGGSGAGGDSTGTPVLSTSIEIQEGDLGFCGVDGVLESTNVGFTGSGYANSDNAVGAGVSWLVVVGEAGTYSLALQYSNGSGADRAANLTIDGGAATNVPFPPTTDWTTWASVEVTVTLEAGTHEILLSATSAAGLVNVDRLEVSGAAVGAVDCNPDTSTGGGAATGGAGSGGAGTGGSGMLPDVAVYVAGDSTVSTYADTASPSDQAGWGQMLHEIFDDRVTVTNRAVGGRTALWFHLEGGTQWILDRLAPGDYWFVQFGTNDSHPTATFTVNGVTYPRLAAANGAFKTHLKDYYLDPAREIGAIPVLVTPPPRNSAYCGNGNSLGGYAQAMRDLAAAEDVLLLDLNQRTFDHLAAICPSPDPENFFFVRADMSVDGTHFQENGARHMANFLGDEMSAQSAGPFQYLLP